MAKVKITKKHYEAVLAEMIAIRSPSVYVYLNHKDPFGNIKLDTKTGKQCRPATIRQYYVMKSGIQPIEEVVFYEENSRKQYFQFVD